MDLKALVANDSFDLRKKLMEVFKDPIYTPPLSAHTHRRAAGQATALAFGEEFLAQEFYQWFGQFSGCNAAVTPDKF